MQKVNLTDKLAQITEHWSPRIAAELNGQEVKLAKAQGTFDWHRHAEADELFLVVKGRMRIEMKGAADVELEAGEFFVVPRGAEHRPVAEEEVHLLLFEPADTLNTGNVQSERTVENPARI